MRTTLKLLTVLGGRGHPLKEGLVSYWELNETSGTRYDAHGTNHLTDNNTVGYAAGVVGNAASFIATNTESLSRASNVTLQVGDMGFTIAVWLNPTGVIGNQNVVAKWDTGGGSKEYRITAFASALTFRVSGDGITNSSDAAKTISAPGWIFAVAWHDPVANTINLQVNNGAVASAAHTTGIYTGGALFLLGAEVAGGHINGLLDQVGIWKRILTAGERTWLYNAGAGRAYAAL